MCKEDCSISARAGSVLGRFAHGLQCLVSMVGRKVDISLRKEFHCHCCLDTEACRRAARRVEEEEHVAVMDHSLEDQIGGVVIETGIITS